MKLPSYIHKKAVVTWNKLTMRASAVFSPFLTHRYLLRRIWDKSKPELVVIGLNPSTATHIKTDPTISRLLRRAVDGGYGSYYMLNLFAFRATDPEEMKRYPTPIGRWNDQVIFETLMMSRNRQVLCMWGAHGKFQNRDRRVLQIIESADSLPVSFGTTKDGHPKHVLYLPSDTKIVPFGI